ncbi:Aquaporin-3 like protein [Verticillium longisporum]|nr:Aquaporin-3 like protein [Verticillium longisporum]KAG7151494.1 Aquaporin-3 like protein [Verticillium longisporum]
MGAQDIQEEHFNRAVDVLMEKPPFWSRVRCYCQDGFSEFIWTFILVLFGDGVVAQVVLSRGTKGEFQSINWGWGIGVMMGVYCGGKPKLPIYALAQLLGAMAAAAVIYGNYKAAINIFEGGANLRTVTGPNATAGVFSTYPAAFMSTTGMFFSEFIASSILQFSLYAMLDTDNIGAEPLLPIGLFFLVFGIGACFGWETGYAINPARDFGPRLVAFMLGYGTEVWTSGHHYFWVPIVAPACDCLFGGFLYDIFIFTGESPINEPMFGLVKYLRKQRSVNGRSDVVHA